MMIRFSHVVVHLRPISGRISLFIHILSYLLVDNKKSQGVIVTSNCSFLLFLVCFVISGLETKKRFYLYYIKKCSV